MEAKENCFEYLFNNFGFQNPPTMVVNSHEMESAEELLIKKNVKEKRED